MPTSIELRQRRARVVESLRAITERAESEDRSLSVEERTSYDQHDQEFRDLTERIERTEAQEQREAEAAAPIGAPTGSPAGAAGQEERTAQRRAAFLQFVRRGVGSLAPEQRALVENTNGEILVPEDLETEIYRSLPGLTVIRALAGQRSTTSDRVRRRSLDEVSVGWGKLETAGQTLTDSMPTTPTEDYTYVEDLYGLAKIGEDELDDSDVNLEAFVRDSFARAIGEAEDTGFTVGTGHTNKMPVGFMDTAGGVTAVDGGTIKAVTIDDFKKLIYAVPAQYRRNGVFVTASTTELAISLLKSATDGQYYWQPSVQAGRPNTFLGYAIHNQEDIAAIPTGATPAAVAAFGDFKAGYRVLDRQGMTLQRLVELYSEDGMVGFKVRFRVGGDVVRPDALRLLNIKVA